MKKFLLSFTPETNIAALVAALGGLNISVVTTLPNMHILIVETLLEKETVQAIRGVLTVEEDHEVAVEAQASTWHLQRLVSMSLPLEPSYSPINNGEGKVVYLVDSGINKTHSELDATKIVDLYSESADFSDATGHGTAMASLINGRTVGVSGGATIKNVKIPMGGGVSISQLLAAFEAILSDHALSTSVKVVNCSWTVPKSLTLDNEITKLQNAGLVVVAAAGNTGIEADTLSPVGLNTVIGVAASDAFDRVVSWAPGASSNWGADVDVTAPGIDITVASAATGGLVEVSGTSGAAAIVSGIICQEILLTPEATAIQIQDSMLNNAFDNKLFRNENIYGTTPNRLAAAVFFTGRELVGTPPVRTMFLAKRGELTVASITFSDKVVSVTHINTTVAETRTTSHFYNAWDWVTITSTSPGVQELHINPPADIAVAKYSILLLLTDTGGNEYKIWYSAGVYANSPAELDPVEIDIYQKIDAAGTLVTVTAALGCTSGCGCLGKGLCCSGCTICNSC